MAEETQKRLREEEEEDEERPCKRPYQDILSLLESEEEAPTDPSLSLLMDSLEQELSTSEPTSSEPTSSEPSLAQACFETDPVGSNQVVEVESHVMRFLQEASDDELGIPPSPWERDGDGKDGERTVVFEEKELDLDLGLDREGNENEYDVYGWWEMDDQDAAAGCYDFSYAHTSLVGEDMFGI